MAFQRGIYLREVVVYVQASVSELVTWAVFTISGELSAEFREPRALPKVVTDIGQECGAA